MQKFFIPNKGLLVRHPKTFNVVPEQGELVDWNGQIGKYWRRRVRCGDGTIKKITPETAEPLQHKKKKKENLDDH